MANGNTQELLGTRNLVLNVIGDFEPQNVYVKVNPEHKLPKEVAKNVRSKWMAQLEGKKEDLIKNSGYKESQVVIDESAQPLPELKVDGKRSMFAGPLMRIDKYYVKGDKFFIEGSPTNYAAMMATQNTDPYGLLDKYGMDGLANSAALSTTPTFVDKDGNEVIQIFKRVDTVGEYPGYWGTAAGNVSQVENYSVFKTSANELFEESGLVPGRGVLNTEAMRRMYEESGLAPKVEFASQLKELGIVRKDANVEMKNYGSGIEGIEVVRNGKKRKAIFYENIPSIQGMVLNIDIDDYTKDGKQRPHFKHEYMVHQPTGIDLDTYQSMELWVKEDEHADVEYIPATKDGARKFLHDTQKLPNRSMPVTQGVILYSVKKNEGLNGIKDLVYELNEKFPIGDEHPFYSRLDKFGSGYNFGTFIQDKIAARA